MSLGFNTFDIIRLRRPPKIKGHIPSFGRFNAAARPANPTSRIRVGGLYRWHRTRAEGDSIAPPMPHGSILCWSAGRRLSTRPAPAIDWEALRPAGGAPALDTRFPGRVQGSRTCPGIAAPGRGPTRSSRRCRRLRKVSCSFLPLVPYRVVPRVSRGLPERLLREAATTLFADAACARSRCCGQKRPSLPTGRAPRAGECGSGGLISAHGQRSMGRRVPDIRLTQPRTQRLMEDD